MTISNLLIVTSFACVLVVACNGGSEPATTIQPTETSTQQTPASDATATMTETASPSPTAPDDDEIAERLPEALLILEDMPTGWTVSQTVEDVAEGRTSLCGIESFASGELYRLTAVFEQAELGRFLNQIIGSFAEGEAKGLMAEFGDAFGSCTEWVDIDEYGQESTWRISPLSFPKFGDETFAFRMSATVAILGIVELDFVIWRRGDVVEVIAHSAIGFESMDTEQTEAFVRRVDDKLRAILE